MSLYQEGRKNSAKFNVKFRNYDLRYIEITTIQYQQAPFVARATSKSLIGLGVHEMTVMRRERSNEMIRLKTPKGHWRT